MHVERRIQSRTVPFSKDRRFSDQKSLNEERRRRNQLRAAQLAMPITISSRVLEQEVGAVAAKLSHNETDIDTAHSSLELFYGLQGRDELSSEIAADLEVVYSQVLAEKIQDSVDLVGPYRSSIERGVQIKGISLQDRVSQQRGRVYFTISELISAQTALEVVSEKYFIGAKLPILLQNALNDIRQSLASLKAAEERLWLLPRMHRQIWSHEVPANTYQERELAAAA